MSKHYKEMGINELEWKKILQTLNREPNFTETGIISVMWSEHCSYKNSRMHLKRFPVSGDCILQGPGENAGIVDIGDDIAITFKVESHNHPSAVEPYEGAATGVGGILRDIFTMGARPIACLDSLRFGDLSIPKNRHILEGVVDGIAGYGNCIGVPTVGGEVYVDKAYNENPLVNVMAVGVMKHSDIRTGKASGEGNPVYIVGSSTGRDGIHGATFASDELSDSSIEDRSSVQAGDPFTEKMLLEACLELYKQDYIIGIQDMGAAGLTCSTFEMSHRGNCGMEIELSKVPQREPNMSSYEIMLSESQERMLVVVKPEFTEEFENIFKKWDVHVEKIGKVIKDKKVIVTHDEKIVAQLPVDFVVDGFPRYEREYKIPEYLKSIDVENLEHTIELKDIEESFKRLLGSNNIVSKRSIFEQYDHEVQLNTLKRPQSSDSAVLRIKGTDKAISVTTDCNSKYCYIDPFKGAAMAVFEAARNIVCSGARPLAITDGLNFGNPYDPEVYYQFKNCIDGIIYACEKLNTPVTGGNVSFYNQSGKKAIYPTPIIGMLGLIENRKNVKGNAFKKGEYIALLGENQNNIAGSEFLSVVHNKICGPLPELNPEKEIALFDLLLNNPDLFNSSHDISEGGLITSLFESAYSGNTGVSIDIDFPFRKDVFLFSEAPGRVLISFDKENLQKIENKCKEKKIPFMLLGKCEKNNFRINQDIDISMKKLSEIFERGLI